MVSVGLGLVGADESDGGRGTRMLMREGKGSRVLLVGAVVGAVVGVGSRLFLLGLEGGCSTRLIFLPSGNLTSRFLKLLEVGVGRVIGAVVVAGIEGGAGVGDDVVMLARSETGVDGLVVLEGGLDDSVVLGVGLDDVEKLGVGLDGDVVLGVVLDGDVVLGGGIQDGLVSWGGLGVDPVMWGGLEGCVMAGDGLEDVVVTMGGLECDVDTECSAG